MGAEGGGSHSLAPGGAQPSRAGIGVSRGGGHLCKGRDCLTGAGRTLDLILSILSSCDFTDSHVRESSLYREQTQRTKMETRTQLGENDNNNPEEWPLGLRLGWWSQQGLLMSGRGGRERMGGGPHSRSGSRESLRWGCAQALGTHRGWHLARRVRGSSRSLIFW